MFSSQEEFFEARFQQSREAALESLRMAWRDRVKERGLYQALLDNDQEEKAELVKQGKLTEADFGL